MPTCVLVLGPPRSGTSAASNVLRTLGVHMGTRFQAADDWNIPGYYSDLDFEDAFLNVLNLADAERGMAFWGADPVPQAFADLVAARGAAHPLWGCKHYLTPFALPALDRVLKATGQTLVVIRTARPHHESVSSLMARSGRNEIEACDFIMRHEYAVQRMIRDLKVNAVPLDFGQLLATPAAAIAPVAAALGVTDPAKLAAAAATIDDSLRRFGRDGGS